MTGDESKKQTHERASTNASAHDQQVFEGQKPGVQLPVAQDADT